MTQPPEDTANLEEEEEYAQALERATAGEFEVRGVIGRGGMATVYLAREVALDRLVAIKVMAPHLVRNPGMAERFKREARVAASLSHPNIVPIHAVRGDGRTVCLVMKCLSGRSLDAILLEHGALPVAVAQVIVRDVAAGLEFAHKHEVVHRDIKPGNILVDTDGEVVVTDFGIAKAREADNLTASGSTIGTPAYMSPEQALGRRASSASDQYSLGAVVYEMLAGQMPFRAETPIGLLYQHAHSKAEPLDAIRGELPGSLVDAVARMLAKGPEERFATLAEASAAVGVPATFGAIDDPVRVALAALAGPDTLAKLRSGEITPRSGAGSAASMPRSLSIPSGSDAVTLQMPRSAERPWRLLRAGTLAILVVALVFVLWRRLGVAGGPTLPLPAATPVATADTAARTAPLPPTPRPARRSRPRPSRPVPVTIEGAIERYRLAIESRNTTTLLASYPAIGADQLARYRDYFENSTEIRFEVIIQRIDRDGAEVRLDLKGFLRYHDRRSGEERIETYGSRARLVDGPTGWRILEIK